MKKNLIVFAVVALLAGLLVSCSSSTDPSDAYRDETSMQIYQAGMKALRAGNYTEAAKRFEALDVQYPFGSETEAAQFYLIYAYYMKEEYILAVASADRFIRVHPTYPHLDYVFYIRGLANFYENLGILEKIFTVDLATRDLTQIKKSYVDFNELVLRFPNSPYAASAHQYLVYLRNIFALHELQVAQFYYDHRAYVAAANRASELVAHYQGAPATIDGLRIMAKSYHELGLTKLEEDTLKVFYYNYPQLKI